MSDLVRCDGCASMLTVNRHGEDPDGERAAWIQVIAFEQTFDACTTSCVATILEDDEIQSALANHTEVVMQVAQIINDDKEGDNDG